MMRNAPLTASQRRALISILKAHKANPVRRKRKVRKAHKAKTAHRRRRMSVAQRRAALRNLKKARAAQRRILRRKYGTTSRKYIRRTRAQNRRQRRAFRRVAKSGYKRYAPTLSHRRAAAFAARARGEDTGDYSSYTADNPFRKGKVRRYHGSRRVGTVFKRKHRRFIITRLRNGTKVTRPWAIRRRR